MAEIQEAGARAASALVKVAEIELLGEKFDLAKNGHFTLCRVGEDAYGRPSAKSIDALSLVGVLGADVVPLVQALLDALGDALQRLQVARDTRLGAGRESG